MKIVKDSITRKVTSYDLTTINSFVMQRKLILIRSQVQTNYPGPSRKAVQAFTVSRQLGQALFQLPSDAGEV